MSDTAEIFTTPESEARLDLVRHLIENSELVPLVRGMSGIGKTLLASRLQESAPSNWVVCHFAADSMMQPERLLAQIARCNGLPDTKEENIRRLVDRFEALRNRGSVPVLLIDDAQELPPTSLITLLRLYERQVEGTPLVSLVLFADEQIDMLLSTPQLQIMSPQSIQVIDLPPLTQEEATDYMHYLLKLEGLERNLALNPGRMARIYRETGGAPGRLSSVILEAVGEAAEAVKGPKKQLSKPMLWGGISFGALVFLLLVFQAPVNQMFSTDSPSPTASVAETEPLGKAEPETPPISAGEVAEPLEAAPDSQAMPPPETGKPAVLSAESEVDISGVGASPSVVEASDFPVAEAERQGPRREQSAPPIADMPASPVDEREVAESEAASGEAPVSVATKARYEAPAAEQRAAADEQTASPRSKALLKSSDWLSEQSPESLTIQLAAGENIESLQKVADDFSLRGEIFTVRTERQGRDWYPLLWGRFSGMTAATEALKRLPPELQAKGAWIRSFASLSQ
ncbi:MAG: AAA family ATPase [Candidatus Thiodiazotropha sp.]